jgi:hypothetical protein
MSIEIHEENYYVGFWSFELPERAGNFLACAWRLPNEPRTWHVQFRFRYYRDNQFFRSSDSKTWWEATLADKTQEELEASFGGVVNRIARQAGTIADFYAARCRGAELQEKLLTCPAPWMHAQEVPS